MSKLPEKIDTLHLIPEANNVHIMLAFVINSIIDYLAEHEMRINTVNPDGSYNHPNGDKINLKQEQPEKSCENCACEQNGKCVATYSRDICLKSKTPYCYWQPKQPEQPKGKAEMPCEQCVHHYKPRGGVYCGWLGGEPKCPIGYSFSPTEQPEYKRLWDEATESRLDVELFNSEKLDKYELALKAAEKEIKELKDEISGWKSFHEKHDGDKVGKVIDELYETIMAQEKRIKELEDGK